MYNQSLSLVYTLAADTAPIFRMNLFTNGFVFTGSGAASPAKNCKIWNPTNPISWVLISSFVCDWVYGAEYINATTVATATVDTKKIALWTMSTGKNIYNISVGSACYCVKLLSPGGTSLAVGGGPWIFVYNYKNGTRLGQWTGHSAQVSDLLLINSTRLASSSWDKTIRIWDITTITSTKSSIMTLIGHTNYVWMSKLINSNTLASASMDSTMRLWDLSSGMLLQNFTGHTQDLQYGVDLYNNETIVTISLDQTFKLWNACTGEVLSSLSSGLQASSVMVLKSVASELEN